MIFTSVEFLIFLVITFILYWKVFNKNLLIQNALVLVCSYFFYAWWDWRFLALLFSSSLCDYIIGLNIHKAKTQRVRKLFVTASILTNISLLGFFKYFNFFIDSANQLLESIGLHGNISSLYIILPVGISFYTFQSLSYTIDIYRRKLTPEKNIINFFAFVSFFPQLLAGPIERATSMIPQFAKPRVFDFEKAKDGIRQMLWGFFKKIVIADTCGIYVDRVFDNYSTLPGSLLLLGVILFTFQIYADFSAYSDIAIGTARLFGFSFMKNFDYPNFSRDPGEYWRRWHISLSTWFRDYLYIPLGGNQKSKFHRIKNIIITFTVSGLWHGANWTFICWGFLNGLYYIPLIIFNKVTKYKNVIAHNRLFPTAKELFQMAVTFLLITLSRVFFRSPDIKTALHFYKGIFSGTIFNPIPVEYILVILLVFSFIVIEWLNREKAHPLELKFASKPLVIRWGTYYALIALMFLFYRETNAFIYFQF